LVNKTANAQVPADHRREVMLRELAWHEKHSENRDTKLAFLYEPPVFDFIVDAALDFLDGKPGEAVLDIASGEGKESLEMARRGWQVIAIDLSLSQLKRTRQRVTEQNPNRPVFYVQANAEQLPFAQGSLRIIHGKAIIHHLDLDIAANEIKRVLATNGKAVFAEPMKHHPLFWLSRRLTPSLRTQDEHPLTYKELNYFVEAFDQHVISEAFLLAPLAYIIRILPGGEKPFLKVINWLHRVDRQVLRLLPFLKTLAWYDSVYLQKGK